jgi:hypothetical protein
VFSKSLTTLTDSLTLLEGYIIGNERHTIQHFQTWMTHLVQHHHVRTFVMLHWVDTRLGGSSCCLQKASQHIKMNQHITNLPDGNSIPSCGVLPTTHSLTHSLPSTTTHTGSWPTQEDASNHLCPWP